MCRRRPAAPTAWTTTKTTICEFLLKSFLGASAPGFFLECHVLALQKMTIDYLAKRPRLATDTECFPNLWMIGFRDVETKKIVKLMRTETQELDRPRIAKILRNHRIYTFNGISYDMPMIMLAMSGATCAELKEANDRLIVPGGRGMPYWEFYDFYGLSIPNFVDHVDLFHVMPSAAQKASLKKYAGMMHSRFMMEFVKGDRDFDTRLSDDEIQEAYRYLDNDLEVTSDAIEEMTPQIEIRAHISVDIGLDVRSKSDAQVGEAIVKQRVEQRMGRGAKLYKPDIVPGRFKYEAPAYIEFKTPEMQAMFTRLLRSEFKIKSDGYVELPEMFAKRKKNEVAEEDDDEYEGGMDIVFNGLPFKMGIGGLHSQEKAFTLFEDEEMCIVDVDVTGYYPNLMLRSGREPANMRGHFLTVFKQIVDERAAAKKAGDKNKAEQGKIASNGLFGKTGSPYSIVYGPPLMIQTTVTGQLSLLMEIEDFTLHGWRVVSANTDGIVVYLPRKDLGMFRSVVFDWECATGLSMEYTFYRSIHAQSVNTYMAFKKKENGEIEVKRKGKFAPSGRGLPAAFGLKKSPHVEISYDAAVQYMLDGTSIESTVRNCQDIRKFVTVRNVKGGAEQDGVPIAKVVRYYYSVESPGPLLYVSNGNRVPRSDGAMPCMLLPDELPGDIDYEFYEREAYAILDECGVDVIDPTTINQHGKFFGHRDGQKTVHVIDAAKGQAVCGAKRASLRDLWVRDEAAPLGRNFCGKCRKLEEL